MEELPLQWQFRKTLVPCFVRIHEGEGGRELREILAAELVVPFFSHHHVVLGALHGINAAPEIGQAGLEEPFGEGIGRINARFYAVCSTSTSTFTSEEMQLRPVSGAQASEKESDAVQLAGEQTVPDILVAERPAFHLLIGFVHALP